MTGVGEVLILLGVVLMLLASVGVLRLPDVFSRMHAGTKAASLGLALVLTGSAFLLPGVGTSVKVAIAVLFQFATAPVAAHVIGRATYRAGVGLWEGTRYDDLAERDARSTGSPDEGARG